ncbi:tyrosine-type recombinase/integrase [Escherichia coli]|nr:tyrosine-type recombinase/integrase [Escherichia coli]EHX9649431.1 tyrosine-type recombinase/integrase [Escherichia coli]EIC4229421.1 tyrosine-type recombinase/integrase [Escherichia coli]EIR2098130.1 tyrosine-type recombinase/integrase [Escherichia coli]HBN1773946.1 tyrosine-type recombinase/integrase [Escherichia coli]
MPSIRPDQLPQLMQTMRTASISLSTRCLFMWQLLTITRPAEAAEARWEEIGTRVEDSCSTHENEPRPYCSIVR